jgi:hypothetical protein
MNYDSLKKEICIWCEEVNTCSMNNNQIDICLKIKYPLECR